jgi:hypothetical protein
MFEPQDFVGKPRRVQAMQMPSADIEMATKDREEVARAIAKWLINDCRCEIQSFNPTYVQFVQDIPGVTIKQNYLFIRPGDWVMKDEQGIIHVIKNHNFEKRWGRA